MIKAKKGTQIAEFTENAWELLPIAKDGSRDGWHEVKASAPKEVADQIKAEKGKQASAPKEVADGPVAEKTDAS